MPQRQIISQIRLYTVAELIDQTTYNAKIATFPNKLKSTEKGRRHIPLAID